MKKSLKTIQKQLLELSIQDAIENLSAISQMDVNAPIPIGIIGKNHFVIQNEEVTYPEVEWLLPETAIEVLPKLKDTYLTIHSYLEELVEKDQIDWGSPKTQKGVQAIMVLLGQSIEKLGEFATFLNREEELVPLVKSDEYRKLQDYYLETFSKKFPKLLEGDEAWDVEWANNPSAFDIDLSHSALSNFEAVKEDEDYELFLLYNDANQRFLTPELIRNIELVCDFDEMVAKSSTYAIEKLAKREVAMRARQIYRNTKPLIAAFYQRKFSVNRQNMPFHLHKMIVALLMAANPAMISSEKKSSSQYFEDFQKFIRDTYHLPIFTQMLHFTKDFPAHDRECLLELYFGFCFSFFTVPGGVKEETLGFIHRLITQGNEKEIEKRDESRAALSFCDQLSLDENYLREGLKSYPNKPLFLHLKASKETRLPGFDPLKQNNFPAKLAEIDTLNKKIDLLRIPSPTRQKKVSEAEINEEFLGFLDQLQLYDQKHLMINLQDPTSWEEAGRFRAIEKLSQDRSTFEMITLNVQSDFYHQSGRFAKIDDAKVFTEAFIEQISNPEEWGYSFPIAHLSMKEFSYFTKDLIEKIHLELFANNEKLNVKERKDFILICYHFIVLKILEILKPDSMSFTCKDALDLGASFNVAFWGFSHLIEKGHLESGLRDYCLWLFHSQALLVRQRAANIERVDRVLSMLDFLERNLPKREAKIHQCFGSLFQSNILELKINTIK